MDFLNFNSVKKDTEKQINEAQEIFDRQVKAVQRLVENKDFTIVTDYFLAIKDINENAFEKAKDINEKNVYFALYKQAKNFLRYVENLKSQK